MSNQENTEIQQSTEIIKENIEILKRRIRSLTQRILLLDITRGESNDIFFKILGSKDTTYTIHVWAEHEWNSQETVEEYSNNENDIGNNYSDSENNYNYSENNSENNYSDTENNYTYNNYDYSYKILSNCTCPDNKFRGIECKHILWLSLKKFGKSESKYWTIDDINNLYYHWYEMNCYPPGRNDTCPICLENIDYKTENTISCYHGCNNSIHSFCWNKYYIISKRNRCVICRRLTMPSIEC